MNLRYIVDHKDFIYSNKIFDNWSDEVWLLKERKQDRNENRSKFSKCDEVFSKFMRGDLAVWSKASVSDISSKWCMLEFRGHQYFLTNSSFKSKSNVSFAYFWQFYSKNRLFFSFWSMQILVKWIYMNQNLFAYSKFNDNKISYHILI
jgi:hypothetical protein